MGFKPRVRALLPEPGGCQGEEGYEDGSAFQNRLVEQCWAWTRVGPLSRQGGACKRRRSIIQRISRHLLTHLTCCNRCGRGSPFRVSGLTWSGRRRAERAGHVWLFQARHWSPCRQLGFRSGDGNKMQAGGGGEKASRTWLPYVHPGDTWRQFPTTWTPRARNCTTHTDSRRCKLRASPEAKSVGRRRLSGAPRHRSAPGDVAEGLAQPITTLCLGIVARLRTARLSVHWPTAVAR